jgi:hypothetical protein
MKKEYKDKLIKMLTVYFIIVIIFLILTLFNTWFGIIAGIWTWGFGLIIAGEKFEDDDWI